MPSPKTRRTSAYSYACSSELGPPGPLQPLAERNDVERVFGRLLRGTALIDHARPGRIGPAPASGMTLRHFPEAEPPYPPSPHPLTWRVFLFQKDLPTPTPHDTFRRLDLFGTAFCFSFMPIKAAGKKDVRQNERRHTRNLRKKRELHDLIQAFENAIKEGNLEDAKTQLPTIQKKLDKAAKSYLPKGRAHRKLSRLVKQLNTAPTKN